MYEVFNRCSPSSQPFDACVSFVHAAELARTLARLYQAPSYVLRGDDVVVIAEEPKGRRAYVRRHIRVAAFSASVRRQAAHASAVDRAIAQGSTYA